MSVEGQLQVKLGTDKNRVSDVSITSSRPLQAVKVFHGKKTGELLTMLPMLYHVCNIAQSNAAVNACENALQIKPSPSTFAARQILNLMETAREHGLHILINWPECLQLEKNVDAIRQLNSLLTGFKKHLLSGDAFMINAQVSIRRDDINDLIQSLETLLRDYIFAQPTANWFSISNLAELNGWLNNHQSIATRMLRHLSANENNMVTGGHKLPALRHQELEQFFNTEYAEQFIARPEWQGQPCETTPLTRQWDHLLISEARNTYGTGIHTRMLARLVELSEIPQRIKTLSEELNVNTKGSESKPQTESGTGISQVEAARGRLIHRVEIKNNIIERYQILAPTEWNFHPRGVAAELLKSLPVKNEQQLMQQATMVMQAIDPCVNYALEISQAA